MVRLSLASFLIAVVLFSQHAYAQLRSNGASVMLVARMEESFTVRFAEAPVAENLAGDASTLPRAVQVLLHWHLRGARSFKIAPAIDPGIAAQPSAPELVTLSELAASSQVYGFLSSPRGPGNVLGAWGDSEEKPVGTAAILLVLPPRDGPDASAWRFSVAIF
jgi:hypothetical protein